MKKPVLFRIVNKLGIASGVSQRLLHVLPLLQDAFEVHVATYREGGTAEALFREKGIPVHHVPLPGKWNPVGLYRLARLLRENGADIVHTHSFSGNISGILAAALAGVPVRVGQVHSRGQHWYGTTELRRKKQRLEEYCVHSLFTRKILFPSKSAREYFAAHCPVSPQKLHLLYNGVRLPDPPSPEDAAARADLRARYGVLPDQTLLGFVGRLAGGKGLHFAFSFMGKLRALGRDARLLVVGSAGSAAADAMYQAKAGSAGPGTILFSGAQVDPYPFYRAFDAFFFPSESWTEAMPGAVLEAAAHGLPVLSRENPAVREIAEFYPNIHFMADEDDPILTLERLLALPPADTSALEENFSIRAMADKTLALYDRLLSGSARSRAGRSS
jgi:glycosyltransferase involved in cell wall biosynthesis